MQGERPTLPTLRKLGVNDNLLSTAAADAASIATGWFRSFSQQASAGDASGVVSLFLDSPEVSCFWRDLLALTWDLRTFQGIDKIRTFLSDRLGSSKLSPLAVVEDSVVLEKPFEDVVWIRFLFRFETASGTGRGVVRIVPVPSATKTGSVEWKAHSVLTDLEALTGFPEATGPGRSYATLHGGWEAKRAHELDFVDAPPKVLVIGGGQSGLEIAARLKYLGLPTLIVEKRARIGDQWRGRYDALCLHDPVWYDHMPYLPFPSTWPVYTPARKLADWLESYAHTLELDVWTSSTVTRATQDPTTKKWTVVVKRGGTEDERTFVVNHVVFAISTVGGTPNMPEIPGMADFKGPILHSSHHKSAKEHAGKKVIVLGACTSAHDICGDYAKNGVDVTMYQRSSTYIMSVKEGMPRALPMYTETGPRTDVADLLNKSIPYQLLRATQPPYTQATAEADRDLLEGLKKRGFQLNSGLDGTGFALLAWSRGGGYYFDAGASALIIDGSIKLKSGVAIERFTPDGIAFADGTQLAADVVVCATGYGDVRQEFRQICSDEIVDRVKPLWGFNAEGEVNTIWRDSGVDGLWVMMGNLCLCRMYSKHLSLQIKAMEEGVFGTRYSAPDA